LDAAARIAEMVRPGELRLCASLARRDARANRFAFAIAVLSVAAGVAGMYSMQLMAAGFSKHMDTNVRQWIAADISLRLPDAPSAADWNLLKSEFPQASTTLVVEIPALAASGQVPDAVTAELKAIDPRRYPFYGRLTLKSGAALGTMLDDQSAVVSQDLAEALQLRMGDMLRIRQAEFRLRGIIASEPDRFTGANTPAPRMVVTPGGLQRTALLRFQQAAMYRVLFQIPRNQTTAAMCRRLEELFPDGEVADYKTPAPLSSVVLDWVVPFLSLMSLLSVAMAVCAIAVLSYLHMLQRLDAVAFLKCLGATTRQIETAYLLQVGALALLGSAIGALIGPLVAKACARLVIPELGIELSIQRDLALALPDSGLVLLSALAAAAVSISAAARTPPAIVLRRDTGELNPRIHLSRVRPGAVVLAALAVMLAVFVAADFANWKLTAATVGVFAGAAASVLLLTRSPALRAQAARPAKMTRAPWALRYAISNLQRHRRQTAAAFLMGALAAALIVIARMGDARIGAAVLASMPFDAPNLLMFNVPDAQLASVRAVLPPHDLGSTLALLPVARMKLVRVDRNSLDQLRAVQRREWVPNSWPVTCSDSQPRSTQLVAGRWWTAELSGSADGSGSSLDSPMAIEENTAAMLHVGVGSEVEFSAPAGILRAKVQAVLRVPVVQRFWYRLTIACRPFTALHAGRYIGGLTVIPARLESTRQRLQAAAPAATVVDASQLKARAVQVWTQAARIITIAAGLLAASAAALFFAAMLAIRPFRTYELAMLRALGAPCRKLIACVALEALLWGAAAGLLGSIVGVAAASWALLYITGQAAWTFDATDPLLAAAITALLGGATGIAGFVPIFRKPPLDTLRHP